MKNVMITGGGGFVGHHLIQHILQTTDWNVFNVQRSHSRRIDEAVSDEHKSRLKTIYFDLKDFERVSGIDVNIIFHVAASTCVERSIAAPMAFVQDNVLATGALLQFARKCTSLEKFLYLSTDQVFGGAGPEDSFNELDRHYPANPYAASKSGGESLCVAFSNTYNIPVDILRTMNVYGIRQQPKMFIPRCIKKISNNELLEIHVNKEGVSGSRQYVNVADLVNAMVFVSSLAHTGVKYYNMSGDLRNNYELAKFIADTINKTLNYKFVDGNFSRPGYDLTYRINNFELTALGWQRKVKFEDGLKQMIDWTLTKPHWLEN